MIQFISTNKAQSSMDLAIALFIFLLAILSFFIYSLNFSQETQENFDLLSYDGNIIMKSILSDGSPQEWNSNNVIKIGILSNNKINSTKLEQFYSLSVSDYQKTKTLFNTRFNYYFFLSEKISDEINGIGKPGTDKNNIQSNNLMKITKFTIYNDKPVTAYLYIWE